MEAHIKCLGPKFMGKGGGGGKDVRYYGATSKHRNKSKEHARTCSYRPRHQIIEKAIENIKEATVGSMRKKKRKKREEKKHK